MKNCKFVEDCINLKIGDSLTFEKLSFDELFNLKYPAQTRIEPSWMFLFGTFEILAVVNKDTTMNVWNGTHPVEENTTTHICKKDSIVKVWMISRMGDVGITDNIIDANGYAVRISIDDLSNFKITKKRNLLVMQNENRKD